jgi:hypothetical protein
MNGMEVSCMHFFLVCLFYLHHPSSYCSSFIVSGHLDPCSNNLTAFCSAAEERRFVKQKVCRDRAVPVPLHDMKSVSSLHSSLSSIAAASLVPSTVLTIEFEVKFKGAADADCCMHAGFIPLQRR